MHSRATDRRSVSQMPGKSPDQAVKHRSDGRECREPSALSHLGFQPVQKTPTIHVSSRYLGNPGLYSEKDDAKCLTNVINGMHAKFNSQQYATKGTIRL